ncbi:O-antigen ligase family protein [Bacillus sp. FJAT-18017]|uniref:O-antigen ligase family protein n=1 Tax=Bacillus sp. FJAT-18017 TaxID=1705566 RepID=UPI0022B11A5C|nr:O-antigen ligase family protein [Bacillus sp. FJAT-18017]
MVLLIAFSLYFVSDDKKQNRFYFLVSLLTFAVMIFTSTRSGWVGELFGALTLTGLIVWKRKYLWKKWAVLLFSLGVVFLVIDATGEGGYMNRLLTTVIDPYNIVTDQATGEEGSYRFFIWGKSLPLVTEYFWLESGPDTFKYVFPNDIAEVKEVFLGQIVDKAHNEYLEWQSRCDGSPSPVSLPAAGCRGVMASI